MEYGTVFQTVAYKDGYTRVVYNTDDLLVNPGHQKIEQDLVVSGNIHADTPGMVADFSEITVLSRDIVSNLNASYIGNLGYSSHIKGQDDLLTAVAQLNPITGEQGDVVVPAWMVSDSINVVQSELDATQVGAGLEDNGSYIPNALSTYLKEATSLYTADQLLDAALNNLSTVVSNLGSAFNYVGTLVAGPDSANSVEIYDVTNEEDGRNTGDYYKITDGGWLTLNGGDSFYVNPGDGIVFNNTGTVDIIDNTNSNVRSGDAYVNVVGNEDTGFDITLDPVFVFRIDTLEQEVDALQAGLQANDLDNQALHVELDSTQTGAGLQVDGTYVPNLNAKYIDSATSLFEADVALDSQLKDMAIQMQTEEYLQTILLISSEAINEGDLVSLSGSGVVAKSRMDNEVLSKVIGVSKDTVLANEPVRIAIHGQLVKGITVDPNSPQLSYGDTVFLSVNGSVSSSPPAITGSHFVVEVGVLVDEVGPVFLFSPRRIAF